MVWFAGRFYHRACIEDLPLSSTSVSQNGTWKFVCPLHKCTICEQTTGSLYRNLAAQCVFCPTMMHERCMPAGILALHDG